MKKPFGILLLALALLFCNRAIGQLFPYTDLQGHWGFADSAKQIILPLEWEDARPFSEGFAPVKKEALWYLIDTSGREVLGRGFKYVSQPSQGYVWAMNDMGHYFLNVKDPGNLSGWFEEVRPSRNRLHAARKDEKWGAITPAGEWQVPPLYDRPLEFRDQYAIAVRSGLWGLLDSTGKEVVPCVFDTADGLGGTDYAFQREGHYSVWNEGKLTPIGYWDRVGSIRNGWLTVEKENWWGAWDLEVSKLVIPNRYMHLELLDDYASGLEEFTGKWNLLNRKGENVLSPLYNQAFKQWGDNLIFKLNGKIGMLDKGLREILPAAYLAFKFVDESRIWFQDGRGVWWLINPEGDRLNRRPLNIPGGKFGDIVLGRYAWEWVFIREDGSFEPGTQVQEIIALWDDLIWAKRGGANDYGLFQPGEGWIFSGNFQEFFQPAGELARIKWDRSEVYMDRTGKIYAPIDLNRGLEEIPVPMYPDRAEDPIIEFPEDFPPK